ncbi:hypothetical protein CDAR_372161 [Caerostris darwini]|uniref:Uncharacterized protein n=1 Tax=Caerostris darwini TaxID=1538125 RepID=A0AAV4VXW8_9ARAC|nr:hypothetical protein CDAR_372161 [Caerostris darwini]
MIPHNLKLNKTYIRCYSEEILFRKPFRNLVSARYGLQTKRWDGTPELRYARESGQSTSVRSWRKLLLITGVVGERLPR